MFNAKQFLAVAVTACLMLQLAGIRFYSAFAQTPGDIVINEVAWAGTTENANDEWIELYNNSNNAVDLSGWIIEDDTTTIYEILSGEIPAHGFFVIEDKEEVISDLTANAVIGLSLANTGDSLVLKNTTGEVIDSVNISGGTWYSGDSTTKTTMERVDPNLDGNIASNWASAISNNGKHGSGGSLINGTAGSANSVYAGGVQVFMEANGESSAGATINVNVKLPNSEGLYAYGMDIIYDPAILRFLSASEGSALNADGEQTSFFAALENGTPGKLVVGNARLVNPPDELDSGVDLYSISFEVLADFEQTNISFANSYLADVNGDIEANFKTLEIGSGMEEEDQISKVTDLQAGPGESRYSLILNWNPGESGSDKYKILKKNQNGDFEYLAETTEKYFVDANNLVPNVTYYYQVIAIKGTVSSGATEISASDNRGISGDNDRSDRVDGRDLENLARAYASVIGDNTYNILVDMNYDGIIDGSDLIDIGANFGSTY